MNLILLSIKLNVIASINDISPITTNCNFSYLHVSLINESNDRFGKLDNDYWIGMFNVECLVKSSILNATLCIDVVNKALVFVKSKDMSLLYNRNNPLIMNSI